MATVSYGTITVTDLTDITDVFLQYGLALSDATVTNSYSFNETGEIGWFILTEDTNVNSNKIYFRLDSGVYKMVINPTGNPYTQGWYESSPYPIWTSGFQIWIRQVQIKEGIEEPDYGTPYLDTAVNQINDSIGAINNSIYTISTNVTGLDNRLKAFFWPGDSSYSGAFAVAKTSDDGLDVSNANTYGFNTRVATGLVSIGYNKIPLSEWGINEGLKMYYPILDNEVVVGNKLGMQLTTSALNLYNPTLSYKEYKGTIGNPRELRLYEYSSLDNTYILTQDTTFLSNKTYYELVKGLEITAEGIDLYNPSGNKGLEITSNGIDIFGENETKGLSMQSGGLIIYDPSETSSNSISLIAVQQTGFRLGYDADTLEGLDPYTTAIAEPFIVWQKAETGEQDAHNRLYIYTDDIILRINDNSSSTQQLFLKDKLSQIDDNILTNSQAINTNKQKIQSNENSISVNTQNIVLNKENIDKNTTDITSINSKLIKIKAYWMIDSDNHLTLAEGVLNG